MNYIPQIPRILVDKEESFLPLECLDGAGNSPGARKGEVWRWKNGWQVRLLSLTTSAAELKALIPLLRALYFHGEIDGLSVLSGPAEAQLKANPWVHRMLAEYATAAKEPGQALEPREMATAARRAVLEEQPDVVLFPAGSSLAAGLSSILREAGIGEYVVSPADPGRPLSGVLDEIRNRHIASVPRPCEGLDPKLFFAAQWDRLGQLIHGPCLLLGHKSLVKECRAQLPGVEFHEQPERESYPEGLALCALSYADRPAEVLELMRSKCRDSLLLEPVNTQLMGGRFTLRYGDYDNEFSFVPAEVDLKEIVDRPHHTSVWSHRCGRAGKRPLPDPDGCLPLFALRLGAPEGCWTDRYRLPEGTRLKIVFADSGNVAGSVLHHASAVNRYTDSQAWALALAPHPLIGAQQDDEETFFLQGKGNRPSERLDAVLREADCFVFFEDDDERSPSWPFPLHQYTEGKAVLHLYIGYRAHQRTPRMQRSGRRILTPLPHILRMYPQATFYAGFPPNELLDIPLTPPLSAQDGICRILHSPSVPHWTTARYPYHKDTEAFLRAARSLKKRYGAGLELHQVGGWSQPEVIRARQACDITFNQLRGFHGLSGDEAMLLERPCVMAFDRSNINRHREYWGFEDEFPWISTSRQGLEKTLSELIDDPDRRSEVGRRSRLFMLKYFSPQKGILPLLFHCYQAIGDAVRT